MESELGLPPIITSESREMTSANVDVERIKKKMFKKAMRGLWKKVVEDYQNPFPQEIMITRSGDTLLHLAVFDGQVEAVQSLVDLISDENVPKVLRTENHGGNTPLHLAAALGNVEMCECIAARDPGLIGARNNEGETPLFLSALHGKKQAFLCLHSLSQDSEDSRSQNSDYYSYCRRNNGETILHCAIVGEYFDLAFQIIRLYEDLVTYNNEKGLSPLHLLALNPSAFKSGSRLDRFDLIIYCCIIVDHLTENTTYNYVPRMNGRLGSFGEQNGSKNNNYYPQNYSTCLTFFDILKQLILVIVSSKQVKDAQTADSENPRQVQRKSASCTLGGGGRCWSEKDEQVVEINNQRNLNNGTLESYHHDLHPPNYTTCFNFFKLAMKALLVVLGLGFTKVRKIREKKEKHTWAAQIMEELVERVSSSEYDNNGREPRNPHIDGETRAFDALDLPSTPPSTPPKDADPNQKQKDKKRKGIVETPILIAAKTGVTEMIEKILDKFPMAIQDINAERKNVALLAVENRQPHVYQLLLKRKILLESVFRKLDNKGNSALHLAATLGEYRPWLIPGAALQMQWEIRWYKFVKDSMPRNFFVRHNNKGKTAKQVFTETHRGLVKEGGEWLTNTSESCSVVAALIATVAFATAATVPGGVKSDTGAPTLEKETAFSVFAISSLVALCFSVTSVIMFLSILTSRYQEQDFASDLPKKLIVGLSSLFISIASMLVSFCAGHFFVLKDKLRYAAYPLYATTCLPVAFFAAAQFPLYFDLIRATFKKVPQRSYKVNVANIAS